MIRSCLGVAFLCVLLLTSNILAQTTKPATQQQMQTLTLGAVVTRIDGDTLTLTALNNPRFLKTVTIETATEIYEKGKSASRNLLAAGSIVLIRQSLDKKTGRFHTDRIQILRR